MKTHTDREKVWILQEAGVCNIHVKFQKGVGASSGRAKQTFKTKSKFLAHPTTKDKPFTLIFQKDYLPLDIDFKKLTDKEKDILSTYLDTHPLFSKTRQHITKSGGRHYIFKYPPERVIQNGHQENCAFTFVNIPPRKDGSGFVDIPWNFAYNDHEKALYIVKNDALPLEITKKEFESLGLIRTQETVSASKQQLLKSAQKGNLHNVVLKIATSLYSKGASEQKIYAFFEEYKDKFESEGGNLEKALEKVLEWCREKKEELKDETPLFDCTHAGLADRIEHYYPEGHLIYNITTKSWHLYDKWFWRDNTFSPLDIVRKLTKEKLILEFSLRAFMAAETTDDPDEREKKVAGIWRLYSTHFKECQSREFINSALEFLKDRPGFAATEDEVNAEGRPVFNQIHTRMNFKNTAYDFDTFQKSKFRWQDYSTFYSPIEFDESAKCPKFEGMLSKILNDNKELISWMQQFLGSCLIGGQNTDKILPVFWGSGNNGKTTLIEIMHKILGKYATTVSAETLAYTKNKDKFSLGGLPGRRFVAAQESEHNARLNVGQVKELTGNDSQKCNRKHQQPFDFRPSFKIILATNNKPKIVDSGDAVWSRVRLVPFTVKIPPEEAIPNLDEIIIKEEGAGVINWLIQGAKLWVGAGRRLPKCKAIDDASKEYQNEENVVYQWVSERCTELTNNTDKHQWTKFTDLWSDFKISNRWVRRGKFKDELINLGYEEFKNAHETIYFPLILKDEYAEEFETENVEKSENSIF